MRYNKNISKSLTYVSIAEIFSFLSLISYNFLNFNLNSLNNKILTITSAIFASLVIELLAIAILKIRNENKYFKCASFCFLLLVIFVLLYITLLLISIIRNQERLKDTALYFLTGSSLSEVVLAFLILRGCYTYLYDNALFNLADKCKRESWIYAYFISIPSFVTILIRLSFVTMNFSSPLIMSVAIIGSMYIGGYLSYIFLLIKIAKTIKNKNVF